MTMKMLVDLKRCVGCWTCSMACKMAHKLPDEEYRVTVQTLGSGAGIDRPQGIYPNLRMSWQPQFQRSCTFCAERLAEGQLPHCVYNCPTKALAIGNDADPQSDFSTELTRCREAHSNIFEAPAYANQRSNVVYASRA